MAEDIFGDLVNWWNIEHRATPHPETSQVLQYALQELGVSRADERIKSKRILKKWHHASEEIYECVVSVDLESQELEVRTVYVAAYAVVTPPGIPIEARLNEWLDRASQLAKGGVSIPRLYLAWQGTLYAQYPHMSLSEIFDGRFSAFELIEIANSLAAILDGLSRLRLQPLGLFDSLRTDGFEVYYCKLGFDLGSSTKKQADALLDEYETDILSQVPENFRKIYAEVKKRAASSNGET